jgi:hypothetical protein
METTKHTGPPRFPEHPCRAWGGLLFHALLLVTKLGDMKVIAQGFMARSGPSAAPLCEFTKTQEKPASAGIGVGSQPAADGPGRW